ncbi:MAG: hypothetical protein SFZ02_11310 [bacterium]|nr:hypothetical protein [bacterium]
MTDETDFQENADVLPDDDTTPIAPAEAPSPIEEMTELRDALQDQLVAYQNLLAELRGLLITPAPTPPPTSIGNPAQNSPLNLDAVRDMDVMTVKRRLDEVLNTLKGR